MTDGLRSRLAATGLRARLSIAVAVILAAAAAATYVAVYRGSGARIRAQIESDLTSQAGAINAGLVSRGSVPGPDILARARRSIAKEPPFAASSRLDIVHVFGAGVATNEPELLGLRGSRSGEETSVDQAAESGEARRILAAPPGFSTVHLEDAGDVRLDSFPVEVGGRTVATVITGQPLEAVDRAQESVSRTFLIAGSLTLAAALVAVLVLAARTAAPLRRMAETAGFVDAGDLTHRMPVAGAQEVRQLAESFNHMLDRLEEAFARQHEFVSDASHELRTPLTAIRGQIEVLAKERAAIPERVEETARRVDLEVARMTRLVDDLLALAETDERLVAPTDSIDPAEFIPETVEGVARAETRHVTLEEIPAGALRVDADRLAQLLRNLVRNAIQHSGPDGEVRVSAAAAGSWLRVVVDDDGPGIPADQREAVFDRFHRTDSARARRAGGSGLGLAIARAIAVAHGGTIQATDSPSGGARLVFELPHFEPGREPPRP